MPDPILFTLGPLTVHWYGVIIGIGMAIGVYLAGKEARRQNINEDQFFYMMLALLVIGVLGARAYYVLFNWDIYGADPGRILAFAEGGLAIHGGLIAGGLTVAIMAGINGIGALRSLDIVSPSVVLGQAIGRWGNFINQEAYGYAVSRDVIPWAMYINGEYRHPTFLYESLWNLLVFAALLFLRRRDKIRQGEVFFAYVIMYSLGRFVIEGFRTDSLMMGDLRAAQVVSVVAVAVSIIAVFYRRSRIQEHTLVASNPRQPVAAQAISVEESGKAASSGEAAKTEEAGGGSQTEEAGGDSQTEAADVGAAPAELSEEAGK